ncbi:BTAD domain-containing putative transcriptional regulator [Sphaerisporangium fuscum]|uniref:BTAD domain-containing putative transcriptional regulator n=1 Tax=Sphaerisporangium fuscum TaxID=2835868 RepID=UPI0020299B52|nr:BTAD domain-containing putative transcriptional regulator [Sphaerisporangium fuscum]
MFRVLGAFELAGDSGPIEVGGRRPRSVLARLLVARRQVVPVDRIIDDLWKEQPPPSALASIQAYVSNLRRVLEPGRGPRTPAKLLVTVPPGYALRAEDVDAWRFEARARQGGELLDAGDPRAAAQVLEQALKLWQGTPYAEFSSAEWAVTEIARLEELHASVVEQRAACLIGLGAIAPVIGDLQVYVGAHPLREEGWRLLALALYRGGRQGDALLALRQARRTLAEELGVDPGPALQRMEADILAQSPDLAGPPAPPPPVAGAAGTRVAADGDETGAVGTRAAGDEAWADGEGLFGRDAELSALMDAAARARSGRLRPVLVTGEAGMGKSALTERLVTELLDDGWHVAVGRCPQTDGAPAGWAWAEILRGLVETFPPDAAVAASIRSLTGEAAGPEDGRPQAGWPGAVGDLTAERFRARRALASYLGGVARQGPLLVVLDDLHRADDETLAVLAHLVADLRATRLLLVLTYREDEGAARLTETAATLAACEPVRVRLRGLDAGAAAGLLRRVAGAEVSPEAVAAVAERTGGNPFFLWETARLIVAEGERAAVSVVPAGVRDVLRRRFVRLPVPAQTVLREAAVIGGDVDLDVLTEVHGGGEEAVVDALEAALMAGLLVEPEPGRIRFAHALVRDTFYDDISGLRRTRTHARVAAVLRTLRGDEVAALAHHFDAGGERAEAARYCALAAEQAERRFAYAAAAALWGRALELGDGEDLELIMRRVRALALASELVLAREHREQAVRLALPVGDAKLTARVIVAFDAPAVWSVRYYGQVSHEIVQAVERTLADLGPGDGEARCALLCSLAFELDGEETARGQQAADEALAMARRLGVPSLLAKSLNARYFHTFRGDGLEERRRIGTELLELARAEAMTVEEVVAHLMLMQQATASLDLPRADRHAEVAERLAERYDLPMPASVAAFYRAFRLALAGEFGEAEQRYREAARLQSKVGAWRFEVGLSFMARYCLRLLDGALADLVEEAEIIAPRWEVARECQALALARAGRVEEARTVLGDARVPIRSDFYRHFFTVVRGLLGAAIGDEARVLEARAALLPYERRPVTDGTAVIPLWPVAQVLGDLALHLGRPEEARARYRTALEVSEEAGAPAWTAAARRALEAVRD